MSFQESKELRKTRLNRGAHWEMAPWVTVSNFRKGSQWFQIKRDLALLVAKDIVYYPKFVKSFCRPQICYIDEHYLPTLFFSTRPKALAHRTLTFFKFEGGMPHPVKWDKTNTTASAIKSLQEIYTCDYNDDSKSRCFFFARKFDANALPKLLELANDVMGIA